MLTLYVKICLYFRHYPFSMTMEQKEGYKELQMRMYSHSFRQWQTHHNHIWEPCLCIQIPTWRWVSFFSKGDIPIPHIKIAHQGDDKVRLNSCSWRACGVFIAGEHSIFYLEPDVITSKETFTAALCWTRTLALTRSLIMAWQIRSNSYYEIFLM